MNKKFEDVKTCPRRNALLLQFHNIFLHVKGTVRNMVKREVVRKTAIITNLLRFEISKGNTSYYYTNGKKQMLFKTRNLYYHHLS
jgi:hypothetical protein